MIKKLKINTTNIAEIICTAWILNRVNAQWYIWILFLFTIVGFDLTFEN